MEFKDFEDTVRPHTDYPGKGSFLGLVYTTASANGEAGETWEKVKKAWRDENGMVTSEKRAALLKELGDQLWYITAAAHELDSTLEEVAQMNIDKLNDRRARSVTKGEGDNR